MPEELERFQGLVLEETGDEIVAGLKTLEIDDLPEGDVLVRIDWSGINYKDALAVTNSGKIVRRFPMVPGIDFSGTVVESDAPEVAAGDEVLVTGYGTGEDCWGGFSRFARTGAGKVVRLPEALTPRTAMASGTAGFTAMLSVMALEDHGVLPDGGEVLVTGASGGVGSFAVAILSRCGYLVAASTGRPQMADYLLGLGATRIVDRSELADPPSRPLNSELWSGIVDSVGGDTLANQLTFVKRHGCIASCGLAGGHVVNTTVFPFILRGVSLAGIDSNYCPMSRRTAAWHRLADVLPPGLYDKIASSSVPLESVAGACESLLAGEIRGRVLVEMGE